MTYRSCRRLIVAVLVFAAVCSLFGLVVATSVAR